MNLIVHILCTFVCLVYTLIYYAFTLLCIGFTLIEIKRVLQYNDLFEINNLLSIVFINVRNIKLVHETRTIFQLVATFEDILL